MEKEVKKNNKRLSNFFSLDIGNLLSRDYNVVGKSCYIYTSTSFDFDRYEISNSPSLETRRVENSEKLIYVSEGDIVVSLISQRATVVRIKEKMFLSPNYIKVTPKSLEIPKEYFVYWFNESYEARKQIEQGMQGSIINKLSINFLRELNFTRIEN
ncbi:MAG: hypothetical protein LBV19_07235, partial [Streptococcaceae bacterium]|nr:hypothetical protein [Streptococcaceae bacterium]